eukprot:TRINITY_DN4548_c0_g1_i1.p1 TRINITY_DN4548_c0_g1~~TRINITY_DN4548_c0_g1_i1.p1  ORF type:complete len:1624 (+),score=421.99 TRINITY_DN4548_c0_g1_i1:68-4939(+)
MSAGLWAVVDALGEQGLRELSHRLGSGPGVRRGSFLRHVAEAAQQSSAAGERPPTPGSPAGSSRAPTPEPTPPPTPLADSPLRQGTGQPPPAQELEQVFDYADTDADGRVSWHKLSHTLVHAALHGGGHGDRTGDYHPVAPPEPPWGISGRVAFCSRFGLEGRFVAPLSPHAAAHGMHTVVLHAGTWQPVAALPSRGMADAAFLASRRTLAVASTALQVVLYDTTRTVRGIGSWEQAFAECGERPGLGGRPFVPAFADARRQVFRDKPPGADASMSRGPAATGLIATAGTYVVQRVVRTPVPHLRVASDMGGHHLASSDREGTVYLWNPAVCRPVAPGERGLTRSFARAIGPSDAEEGEPAAAALTHLHEQYVTCLLYSALSPAGEPLHDSEIIPPPAPFLVTGSLDRMAKVLDLERREVAHVIHAQEGIHDLVYASMHRLLVTCGTCGDPRCWSFSMPKSAYSLRDARNPHVGTIVGVRAPEQSHHVVSADEYGTVKVWDLRRCQCLQTLMLWEGSGEKPHRPQPVGAIGIQRDRSVVRAASQLFYLPHQHRVATLGAHPAAYAHGCVAHREWAHEGPVRGVRYVPRVGCFVTWAAADVRLWHAPTGRLLARLSCGCRGGEEITAVATQAADRWLVVGTSRGNVRWVDPRHGGVLRQAQLPRPEGDARGAPGVHFVYYITGLRFVVCVDARSGLVIWRDGTARDGFSLIYHHPHEESAHTDGASVSKYLSTLCVLSGLNCRLWDPCFPDRGITQQIDLAAVTELDERCSGGADPTALSAGSVAPPTAVATLGEFPCVAVFDVGGGLSLWSIKPYRVPGTRLSESVCLYRDPRLRKLAVQAACFHAPSRVLYAGDEGGRVVRLDLSEAIGAANLGPAQNGALGRYDCPAWEAPDPMRSPSGGAAQAQPQQEQGDVNLWPGLASDLPLGAELVSLLADVSAHTAPVTAIAALTAPGAVVTAGRDNCVLIWTLGLRSCLGRLAMGRGPAPGVGRRRTVSPRSDAPEVPEDPLGLYSFELPLLAAPTGAPGEVFTRVPPLPAGPDGVPGEPAREGWSAPAQPYTAGGAPLAGASPSRQRENPAAFRWWRLLRRRADNHIAAVVLSFLVYIDPLRLRAGRAAWLQGKAKPGRLRKVARGVIARRQPTVPLAVVIAAGACAASAARRRRSLCAARQAAAGLRRAAAARARDRPLASHPAPADYGAERSRCEEAGLVAGGLRPSPTQPTRVPRPPRYRRPSHAVLPPPPPPPAVPCPGHPEDPRGKERNPLSLPAAVLRLLRLAEGEEETEEPAEGASVRSSPPPAPDSPEPSPMQQPPAAAGGAADGALAASLSSDRTRATPPPAAALPGPPAAPSPTQIEAPAGPQSTPTTAPRAACPAPEPPQQPAGEPGGEGQPRAASRAAASEGSDAFDAAVLQPPQGLTRVVIGPPRSASADCVGSRWPPQRLGPGAARRTAAGTPDSACSPDAPPPLSPPSPPAPPRPARRPASARTRGTTALPPPPPWFSAGRCSPAAGQRRSPVAGFGPRGGRGEPALFHGASIAAALAKAAPEPPPPPAPGQGPQRPPTPPMHGVPVSLVSIPYGRATKLFAGWRLCADPRDTPTAVVSAAVVRRRPSTPRPSLTATPL